MLRILSFCLLIVHICTGWVWLYTFHWLQQFKPDLLSNTEFEGSVGLPMIVAYTGIGVGLGFVTMTGGRPS